MGQCHSIVTSHNLKENGAVSLKTPRLYRPYTTQPSRPMSSPSSRPCWSIATCLMSVTLELNWVILVDAIEFLELVLLSLTMGVNCSCKGLKGLWSQQWSLVLGVVLTLGYRCRSRMWFSTSSGMWEDTCKRCSDVKVSTRMSN